MCAKIQPKAGIPALWSQMFAIGANDAGRLIDFGKFFLQLGQLFLHGMQLAVHIG